MGRIYDVVEAFLVQDGWPCKRLEDQDVAMSSFKGKKGEFNCFIQAREAQEHMIIYSVLPVLVPEERRDEIALFLTRANYGMPVGNFEMDYSDGEVRYKTSIDLEDIEEFQLLLRNLLYANVLNMDKYFPGMMRVIFGGLSAVEAIAEIEG
jgi:hypothetical protein